MAEVPQFFGLNLGHHSLKISQLRYSGNKAKLEVLSSIPTAVGLLENESDKSTATISAEIIKAIKSSNLKVKNCVMSIPEVSIYSRLLTLPKVKDEEIEEAIHFAIKTLIPVPLESVNISFLDVDEKVIEGNTFVNWYVVAAPKQLISRFQDIMEKSGINLLAVETEALAISRLVGYDYAIPPKETVMIIDFGAETSNVILARNSGVIFSQSIGTGSNSITKVIASDFGLDMVQAESYKVTYGLDPAGAEGKIAKSIEPIVQIIVGEAFRTLTYYREKIGGDEIKQVFLTGGGSGLPKLAEFITSKLGVQAILTEPLKNIEVDRGMAEKLKSTNVRSYNVAIGLSLKGLSNR
jgi:type IV pilus assembly protein PilM